MFFFICLVLLTTTLGAEGSGGGTYKSTSIDEGGSLHLFLASGQDVLAPKENGQVGFETPSISSDGKTIGWLELYPFPRINNKSYDPGPVSGVLILYRNRHIIQRFKTEQVIWGWHFWHGGNEVAYSSGPTHGGATQALLLDVTSGKVLARWIAADAHPPDWAKGLRY